MKLVSFKLKEQEYKSFGILTDLGIIDLGKRLNAYDLKAFLTPEKRVELKSFLGEKEDFTLAEICFLPVIEQPNKILCVGMNYAKKREEFDAAHNVSPIIFIRFADSQTAHQDILLKPKLSDEFDYEGEMAVIIGKTGRNIPKQNAYDFVAGYSCYMDGSARDWQNSSITAGKNWPKTGAFGPSLVTTDEITDPHSLSIKTYLNNQMVQDDHTKNMIYSIAELIHYISTFTELNPGDVILSGSPGGVGKKRIPPLFLKEGDIIEVEIEKIGRLTNTVIES